MTNLRRKAPQAVTHPAPCPTCGGTGFVDAPSHSIERSYYGVPPIGVYFCRTCKYDPKLRGDHPQAGEDK